MYILTKHSRVDFRLTDTCFYDKQKMVSSNIRASTVKICEAYPTHPFFKIDYENIRMLFRNNEFDNGKNKAWEVCVEEENGDIKINNGFVKIVSVIKEIILPEEQTNDDFISDDFFNGIKCPICGK